MARCGEDLDGVGHVFGDSVKMHMDHTGIGHLWKSSEDLKPRWNWYTLWKNEDGSFWTDEQFVQFCHEAADCGCLFNGPIRPGYKEGIDALAEAGHTIIIHTDRPFGSTPEVSEKITVEWLSRHEIYYDELWFGPNKWESECDFFIDDKLENYDSLVDKGIKAYLLNRPWNEVPGGDARNRVNNMWEYVADIEWCSDAGYAELTVV
jgi:hypothetical protein